jgi:hypothetical protein
MSLDDWRNKRLSRIRERRGELDREEALLAQLPDTLPVVPSSLTVGGLRADARLTYTEQGRTGVRALMEAHPPVPVAFRQRPKSFLPLARITDEESAEEDVWVVAPFTVQMEHRFGRGVGGLSVRWWTQSGPSLIQVVVELPDDPAGLEEAHTYGPGQKILRYDWRPRTTGFKVSRGQLQSYASGSHDTAGVTVLWWDDADLTWEDVQDDEE